MLIAFKMKLFKAVAQDLGFFFPVQANQHFVFVFVRVFFSSSPLPLYWLINSKLLRVQVGGVCENPPRAPGGCSESHLGPRTGCIDKHSLIKSLMREEL